MAPRTRSKWGIAAAIGAVPLSAATAAFAAEPPIDLRWQAPPECPGREVVLARMQRMLGASWETLAPLRASGVIERRSTGFELELAIDDGRGGRREVVAQSCDELGGVAAVALVLLLTSSGHLDATEAAERDWTPEEGVKDEAPAQQQYPETAPSEDEDVDELPDDTDAVAAPLRWLVDAPLFGLAIGPLPKPYPSLGLGLGLERGAFSLRLVGHWALSQQIPASTAGYGAEVRRLAVGAWVCGDWGGGVTLSVAPCLQASLTHLSGRGYGPDLRAASQAETSAAVGAGALVRWRLRDQLAVLVGGGVQVELSRPVLKLKPLGTFHQLAPFSATLLLGPEWIF